MKRDVIAQMRAAGKPLNLAEILRDMPPEERNFAMIPLLKEAMVQRQQGNGRTQAEHDSAQARLERMCDPVFKKAKRQPAHGPGSALDLALLPQDNPFGRTPESFLREYESRNAGTLQELREGLSRPETRQPIANRSDPDWAAMNESFGFLLTDVAYGLNLRAHAAMKLGDHETAAESIVIALRLGAVAGSRSLIISQFLQKGVVASAKARFVEGLELHIWTEAELDRIRFEFSRMVPVPQALQALDIESIAWLQTWSRWNQDRQLYRNEAAMTTGRIQNLTRWFPSGWFDWNGAVCVRNLQNVPTNVVTSGVLSSWANLVEERNRGTGPQSDWLLALMPAGRIGGQGFLVRGTAEMEVLRQQAMLVCDLECYRIQRGKYPANLAELKSPAAIDPMSGAEFLYRLTDDGFLLYSVGSNGKDDHRIPGRKNPADRRDWVW